MPGLAQSGGDSSSLMMQSVLLIAGISFITMWLMIRLRRKRWPANQDLTPREEIERTHQARGMRGDLEDLMVEIEQLAKRLGAQLDAKSVEVERLLGQAEERIAELRRLQEGGDASPKPAKPAAGAAADDPPTSDPIARQVYALADDGHDAITIAKRLDEHVGKVELILALRAS